VATWGDWESRTHIKGILTIYFVYIILHISILGKKNERSGEKILSIIEELFDHKSKIF